jgi:PTS system galactitol-specific IIB component
MSIKKILVVCGAGVATSTVVARKLEQELGRRGLQVQVQQCKVTEVPFKAPQSHLIVTTTLLGEVAGVPVVQTLSFLTGVGIDEDIDKIAKLLEG